MTDSEQGRIIRKSVALLVLRVFLLQLMVVVVYLLIRLPKTYILAQLLGDPDYHHLNFWLGIIVFLAVIIGQTTILMIVILRWANEYYILREDTIVHTKGIVSQNDELYSLRTIEAASVQQTILGKILNYGTVRIYSPVLKKEYLLQEIPNPNSMKDVILDLLNDKGADDTRIIPRNR